MQVYETGRRKKEGKGEGIGDEIIKKNKLPQYKVGGGNCDDKTRVTSRNGGEAPDSNSRSVCVWYN
jgi:hypothetical protein